MKPTRTAVSRFVTTSASAQRVHNHEGGMCSFSFADEIPVVEPSEPGSWKIVNVHVSSVEPGFHGPRIFWTWERV